MVMLGSSIAAQRPTHPQLHPRQARSSQRLERSGSSACPQSSGSSATVAVPGQRARGKALRESAGRSPRLREGSSRTVRMVLRDGVSPSVGGDTLPHRTSPGVGCGKVHGMTRAMPVTGCRSGPGQSGCAATMRCSWNSVFIAASSSRMVQSLASPALCMAFGA